MTPAASESTRAHAPRMRASHWPRQRAAVGWATSLLVLLALVIVLVRLDAMDPLVWGLASGVAAWLAWAAIRFARAPMHTPRAASRQRRWRRSGQSLSR